MLQPNLDGFKTVAENMGIDLAKYDQSPYTNLAPDAELFLNGCGLRGDYKYEMDDYTDVLRDGENDRLDELVAVIISPERKAVAERYRQLMAENNDDITTINIRMTNAEWDQRYEFVRLNNPEFNLLLPEFILHSKYDDHRYVMELNHPLDHEWGIVVAALLDDELSNDQRSALEAAAFTDFQYVPDDDMQP